MALYCSNTRPLRDATKSAILDPQETGVANHSVRSVLGRVEKKKKAITFRARIGVFRFVPKKSLIQR